MAKDFVDMDLSRPLPQDESVDPQTAAGRLSRQKEEIATRVADAAEEIERLRMRQEELEYARKSLQELNRKQDEYARGKKELVEGLMRSIMLMEKDEVRANRMVELLAAGRRQCRTMLGEIRGIHEEQWDEEHFEESLDKALALVDNARMEYNKTVAKIDAERRSGGDACAAVAPLDDPRRWSLAGKGFWFWLKVGVALSLPLVLLLSLLGVGLLVYLSRFAGL